ncbi:MAG: 30S ribosomal protein S6 [Candidatus Magasanikbacteria bacterium CG10_big_fil_rev_8_21_14_0_10_43_6]|uniref:Small ribosomal subunit protein bS6 n=1 Tax=Candidatus Magasanikbacteria bacterium CG10_big_fil_rev_8_21_14_0_10_43_6 TaxID=1974650 RepID=A0A2M6W0L5_9BACT|nr:MAG: 30S ribosomal protein S6 [Candidatus Magasanikbacteria bacterium CG10_big_fil_rev_8_21_14_0_10_43_6]
MNKHYELLCIFPGTLAEDELPALLKQVTDTIEEVGGESVHSEDMGKQRLAYPMKHIRYGYFFIVTFAMDSETLPALQNKLGLLTSLLRTVLNTYDPQVKEALESRLTVLKSRLDARTGMGPKEEEQEEHEDRPAPKKVTPKPKKEEPVQETKGEKPKKEVTKEEPVEKKDDVDMKDINKKLDALLDDTMSDL